MDNKTKEYYRTRIKEISQKTKISEIYIARKIVEIASKKLENTKPSHIGYYLIDKGINELLESLNYKNSRQISSKDKTKVYLLGISFLSLIISVRINGTFKPSHAQHST